MHCLLLIMVLYVVSAVFIFLVSEIHGQSSFHEVHLFTKTEDQNYTFQPNCSLPLMNAAPIWCPYNYHLLYLDRWTRICKPSACVEISLTEDTLPEFPDDICVEDINHQASTIKLCRKDPFRMLDDSFTTCPKTLLTDLYYAVQINGSLWNKRDSTVLPLGNYFMFENKSVLICNGSGIDSEINSESLPKNVIPWCVPIPDVSTNGQKELINSLAKASHSILGASKTMSTVCITTTETISLCNVYSSIRWFYGAFATDPNQTLIDLILMNEISFGDYFLDLNTTTYYYCEITSRELSIERHIIGSIGLLSHVCLLITIGLHSLYPKLNYYSRALFCHTICMCIYYLIQSISNISLGPHTRILTILTFSISFVCATSAFLWLNVLAFELWKGFATLTYNQGDRRASCVTRKFLLECLYAYGLAVLVYTIAIFIHFNRNIHKILKFDASLTSSGEFQNMKTELIFKGIPLQIILLFNVVFYILTVLNIQRTIHETDMVNRKHEKKLLTIYGKLLLIIGITWVPNLIQFYTQIRNSVVVNYLLTVFNGFQGVFILLVYCCNKRTMRIIKKTNIRK